MWWFTHHVPIIEKDSTYAAYWGQACVRAPPSALPWASTDTRMMSSVAAMAKTPSEKASRRLLDTRLLNASNASPRLVTSRTQPTLASWSSGEHGVPGRDARVNATATAQWV